MTDMLLSQVLKLTVVGQLILLMIIMIFRTIIAGVVAHCAENALEYRGYTYSVDRSIFRNVGLIAFLFTILVGIILGPVITFFYLAILCPKGSN